MKIISFLFIFLLSFTLHADPAPFGLVINKTTMDELKSKYPTTPLGINKNNGLEAFDIAPQNIDFEGLISAKAAFSDDGILKIVQVSLSKAKFEDIYSSLNKKYSLIYKNIPAQGNKEAKFEDGNTYILLYAAAASQEMDFLYINKKLLDDTLSIKPKVNEEQAASAKKEKEISQL